MSQLGEQIALGAPGGELECPFDHEDTPVEPRKNVLPRWEANDANILADNLANDHLKPTKIDVGGDELILDFTAHHLIPGNASWPNTQLRKWVDKRPGHIQEHIGYDVNEDYNGVSLPGNKGYTQSASRSWSKYGRQAEYAFEAMKHSDGTRQFHDAHPAYNEFVTKVLDKVSEKLDRKIREGGSPGCGKKYCAGDTTKKKKFRPPLELMGRLMDIANRLRFHLRGSSERWKMPIYTSRFALMYQMKINEEQARDHLSKAIATAAADKF